MTWEEKFEALNCLAPGRLIMRKPGDWYISRGIEVTSDSSPVLKGMYGNGTSPEQTILNDWDVLVDSIKPDEYLVVSAGSVDRKHFRWNGFMWNELPRKPKAT